MLAGLKPPRGAEKARAEILSWIEKNKPRPGERFLSQRELADKLEIDPMTAHKALKELTMEGVLYRKHGSGTFIGPDPALSRTKQYAFILPRSNMDNPSVNMDCWHIVRAVMEAFVMFLREDEIFSTVILSPDAGIDDARKKTAMFNALFFSGEGEYRKIIGPLCAEKQIVIIGSSEKCALPCLRMTDLVRGNTRKAVSYLLASGHRRVAFLGSGDFPDKLDGYKDALDDYGIKPSENDIVTGLDTQADGPRGASILMSRGFDGDCVFVDTDLKAMGVIDYLTKQGIKIPGDISVMGYDGMDQFTQYPPFLTSFKNPWKEQTERALSMLRERKSVETIDKSVEIPGRVTENKTVRDKRI